MESKVTNIINFAFISFIISPFPLLPLFPHALSLPAVLALSYFSTATDHSSLHLTSLTFSYCLPLSSIIFSLYIRSPFHPIIISSSFFHSLPSPFPLPILPTSTVHTFFTFTLIQCLYCRDTYLSCIACPLFLIYL